MVTDRSSLLLLSSLKNKNPFCSQCTCPTRVQYKLPQGFTARIHEFYRQNLMLALSPSCLATQLRKVEQKRWMHIISSNPEIIRATNWETHPFHEIDGIGISNSKILVVQGVVDLYFYFLKIVVIFKKLEFLKIYLFLLLIFCF